MREFRYKALGANGQMVAGIRRAESAAVLSQDLMHQNLILLENRPTLGSLGKSFSRAGRAGRRELRDFTLHVATCLSAGIPVITALRDFERDGASGPFQAIISDLREEISGGAQISEALAQHPEVFSDVYIAIVAAGQDSGDISGCFADLVGYLEWLDDLRSQTKQALAYPALLSAGVVGLFMLMMLYVVPRFMEIFQSGDVQLPGLTLGVIAVFDWLRIWWPLLLVGAGATAGAVALLKRTDRGRLWLDTAILKVPVMGGFMHKIALSRFAKHFSLLFGSGTNLLRLLELLEDVVGNAAMGRELAEVRQRVMTGETLAASFARAKSFPPLIQRLVAVGEQAGQLDLTLGKAATYLDREIPRALKQTFTALEAVLIVVLGGLIAVAALSVLLPILNLRSAVI
ncbi:MAG: type II secretion system F family protein [bacterium]|nr:type II secretion system F family protein [bacterium]